MNYNDSLYSELKPYLKDLIIPIKSIPDNCRNLTNLSVNKGFSKPSNLRDLANACKRIDNGEYVFNCFIEGLSEIPLHEATEIFGNVCESQASYNLNDLVEEILQTKTTNFLNSIGFTSKPSGNGYSFNANIFVHHLLQRADIVVHSNGTFAIYNLDGYFKIVDDIFIGKVIRFVMHQVKENIWTSRNEAETSRALRLEAISVSNLNCSHDFLNLENGMLNINTLELLPHSSRYLSSVRIPFGYDSTAVCPRFVKFIDEITQSDDELVIVLQELLGYLLTSETRAEKAFMFYGTGANGKSVLAKVIQKLVGEENISNVSLSKFSQQFGLQPIIGKTVNIASENEIGNNFINTESLKSIISGDQISISIKYHDDLKYSPICKLIFLINSLPDTQDNTYGYYRKLLIIPFNKRIPDSDKDIYLFEKLELEMPGILSWAINGLQRLRKNKFQFSHSFAIDLLMQKYEESQNPVLDFVSSHIDYNLNSSLEKREIVNQYKIWLTQNGMETISFNNRQFWKLFKTALEKYSISYAEKKVQGYYYVKDIRFKKEDI